jgi:hypothetical protein
VRALKAGKAPQPVSFGPHRITQGRLMASQDDDESKTLMSKRALTVIAEQAGTDGQSCTTCTSSVYIWEEEIALVRAMNEVKQQVRVARERGDDAALNVLRDRFQSLRSQMEKVRRRRLDSLGHYDYD